MVNAKKWIFLIPAVKDTFAHGSNACTGQYFLRTEGFYFAMSLASDTKYFLPNPITKTKMDTNTAEPSPHAMRQSCIAFSVFLLFTTYALFSSNLPSQNLYGILWVGIGLLMVLLPPVVRIPKTWTLLAFGFVLFSLLGFLPQRQCALDESFKSWGCSL